MPLQEMKYIDIVKNFDPKRYFFEDTLVQLPAKSINENNVPIASSLPQATRNSLL